jgi:uncharacterized protein YjbI with pentapeptide repeats
MLRLLSPDVDRFVLGAWNHVADDPGYPAMAARVSAWLIGLVGLIALAFAITALQALFPRDVRSTPQGYGGVTRLVGVRLVGQQLPHVDMREADLSGAVLSHTTLTGADLRRVTLTGAVLRSTVMTAANLRSAHLEGTTMTRTTAVGACLRDADLRGSDLSEARLAATDLRGADLRGATLAGADFTRAMYDVTTRWPSSPVPQGAVKVATGANGVC